MQEFGIEWSDLHYLFDELRVIYR